MPRWFLTSYQICLNSLPESLQESVKTSLQSSVAIKAPVLVHMIGIPGSGKSTATYYMKHALRKKFPVIVSFDQLMQTVPAYQNVADRELAFRCWEGEAKRAGYCLVEKLLKKNASFIFDHSGATSDHVKLLQFSKKYFGYRIAILRLIVDLDVAYRRIDERFVQDRRFVPKRYISERVEILDNLIFEYREVADEYLEVENNECGSAALRSLQNSCIMLSSRLC